MTGTDTADMSSAVASRPLGRVAAGTHAVELARLASVERSSAACDPLTVQSFLWLLRACNAVQTALADELRAIGLSMSGFNALMALHNTPGRTLEPWQLAERLLVSRPSVTGLLDTLQAKGLVVRTPHADDRRRVLVVLTPEGAALLEGHADDHYTRQNALFADLSADERDTLVGLLRRVRGAAPADLATDA